MEGDVVGGMVVRVKVKHVLAIMLAVVLLFVAFTYGTDTVLLYAARRAWNHGRSIDALALYDRLLERCDACPGAEEALYRTASHLAPRDEYYGYKYVFDNDQRPGAGAHQAKMMRTAKERYAKLLTNFPQSKWSAEAAQRLLDILIELGEWEEAERVLAAELAKGPPDAVVGMLEAKRVELAYARGSYEEAIELGVQYEAEWLREERVGLHFTDMAVFDLHLAVGDAYLHLGEIEEAAAWYERAQLVRRELNESYRTWRQDRLGQSAYFVGSDHRSGFDDSHLWQSLAQREQMVKHARAHRVGTGGSIVGHIEGAEVPQGIDVLLTPVGEDRGWVGPGDPYLMTTTDANGAFRFDGLPDGQYRVGLRFRAGRDELFWARYVGEELEVEPGSERSAVFRIAQEIMPAGDQGLVQLSGDLIQIAWQPVPGALYYYVILGQIDRPQGGLLMQPDWFAQVDEDTHVLINMTQARQEDIGRSLTYTYPPSVNSTHQRLGAPHHGGEYVVQIRAYDERGVVAVSRSDTYTFDELFILGDLENLSRAERLLYENKYEEAISVLEQQLAADSDDVTAALLLLNIRARGEWPDGTHKDLTLARSLAQHVLCLDISEKVRGYVERYLEHLDTETEERIEEASPHEGAVGDA